jgi:Leucine-rich repeat (LRR) protein
VPSTLGWGLLAKWAPFVQAYVTDLEFEPSDNRAAVNSDMEPLRGMTRLTSLELAPCTLMHSWKHLAKLPDLQSLTLRRGYVVSRTLARLTQLTSLVCHGFTWDYDYKSPGWKHLRPLCRLLSLELSNCALTEIPESVSALTQLTMLSLHDNPLLEGRVDLPTLTRLRVLDLENTGLRDIPAFVGGLPRLSGLDLSLNDLAADPDPGDVLRNCSLLDLSLRACGLTRVPRVPASLTSLNLQGNPLTAGGWRLLLDLPDLRHLCVPSIRRVPWEVRRRAGDVEPDDDDSSQGSSLESVDLSSDSSDAESL